MKPQMTLPQINIVDDGSQPDNLQVQITPPISTESKTFQVMADDGTISEQTINVVVPQSVVTTTLSDLKRSLSDKEILLSQAQQSLVSAQSAVDAAQNDIDNTNALIAQIDGEMQALPVIESPAQVEKQTIAL